MDAGISLEICRQRPHVMAAPDDLGLTTGAGHDALIVSAIAEPTRLSTSKDYLGTDVWKDSHLQSQNGSRFFTFSRNLQTSSTTLPFLNTTAR